MAHLSNDRRILVIGADSAIGAAVAARLQILGAPVIRTSRRGTPGFVPLDLAAISAQWRPPAGIAAAVLCAGITSIDTCRDRFDECHRVNVDAVQELGHRVVAAGARVIFPSTNMVFDGGTPFTPAMAERCPRTAYGRMKAEAEERLLSLGDCTTVVRLTKVVGRSLPVIDRWRESLGHGNPIRPVTDLRIAPVALEIAAAVIVAAAQEPLGSILQVSARAEVSYAEVAYRLARRWGVEPALVRPGSAAELGLRLEHLPAHTTLDSSTVRDKLGIAAPDPWAAVGEVV